MGNAWSSGQISKAFTNRPRPRYIWNLFLFFLLGVILCFVGIFFYQVLEDYICYQTQQIYLDYRNEYLITNSDEFKIMEKDKQDINVNALIRNVDIGEPIDLTIGTISGELLQVTSQSGQIVYKVSTIQVETIIALLVLVFPIIAILVFLIIAVNVKRPKGPMEKFQRKYLLRKR